MKSPHAQPRDEGNGRHLDGVRSPSHALVQRLWPKLPRALGPLVCKRWLV